MASFVNFIKNSKKKAGDVFDSLPGDKLKRKKLKTTIVKHNELVDIYNINLNEWKEKQTNLNDLRKKSSNKIFKIVTIYINSLANSPKVFDASYHKLGNELVIFKKSNGEDTNFEQLAKEATEEFVNKVSGGALAGFGASAFGPPALTSAVSAFGTASTGVAISSLHGAAATNATAAWIGGGAKAIGGAGIAGGKAVLALATPIGWAVASGFAIKAGIDYSSKNKKIISEVNEKIEQLKEENKTIINYIGSIKNTIKQTEKIYYGILKSEAFLTKYAPKNYLEFNEYQAKELTALINNVNSFSELLNTRV